MRILALSLSHKTAPLELREKLAFSETEAIAALKTLEKRFPHAECLLLSTCNRTELYIARPLHSHPRLEEMIYALADLKETPVEPLHDHVLTLADADAVAHLFAVAAGLESMVPGEVQIIAQLKAAMQIAEDAGVSGSTLRNLVAKALHVAKEVRTNTDFARGRVSVASIALDHLENVTGGLAEKNGLLIGAGKVGALIAEPLNKRHLAEFTIANRSFQQAEAIAAPLQAQPADLADLPQLLTKADVVICSTANPDILLNAELIQQVQLQRKECPLWLLDLAVPRDISPHAADIPGVHLTDIDDLQETVEATLQSRLGHAPMVRDILNAHLAEYLTEADIQTVAPTIDAFYQRVETILEEELADAKNKFSTHDDAEEDLAVLQRTLRRALRRFCHPAVDTLKAEAASGSGAAHAQLLRKLFKLDESDGDVMLP